MKKIAMYNNKGGVGKTTITLNLAYLLSLSGVKVLVVDCDEQRNSYRFFENGRYEKIDVVTYDSIKNDDRIGSKMNEYNQILFDMPPVMNDFTKSVLNECDYVFVPLDLSSFSIQGLSKVTDFIAGSNATFGGCFASKIDRRNTTDIEMDTIISQNLGEKYLNTKIPCSNVIKNSVVNQQTAYEYKKWTSPVIALGDLAEEILEIIGEG